MALTPSEREKARASSDGTRGSLAAGNDKSLSNQRIDVHASSVADRCSSRLAHARYNKARAERSAIIADESKRRPRTRSDLVDYRGLFSR